MKKFVKTIHNSQAGLTFLELVITMAIIGILAAMVLPLSVLTVKRTKELELRRELRTLRQALDKHKTNYDNHIYGEKVEGDSGYPRTLQELVDKKILRRIPKDPMTGSTEWGTRSFSDLAGSFATDGRDVYDVYTGSDRQAINGSYYKEW